MSTTAARRLGKYVLARRLELDLNQLEIAADGGPSNSMLTTIEHGRLEKLTRQTARKLDRGLRWEPGSARRAWEGGEPHPLIEGVDPRNSAILRRYILEADDLDDGKREKLLQVLDDAG